MKKWVSLLCALLLAAALSACSENRGSVYFLNPLPEHDAAWQALAESYTAQTGIPVTVRSVKPEDYEEELRAALEKGKNIPTLLNITGKEQMENLAGELADLTNAKITAQLESRNYALKDEEEFIRAVAVSCRIGGIIVNKALLLVAGYEMEDLQDLHTLRTVAENITARAEELGFGAFACPALTDRSQQGGLMQMANSAVYHGQDLRELVDVCVQNAVCPDHCHDTAQESMQDFTDARAVFYIAGDWAYEDLTSAGMKGKYLSMLPVYCGAAGEEAAGMTVWSEYYWAVSARAEELDAQATQDFLSWLVTSEEGTAFLSETFGAVPYKHAATMENTLTKAARPLWKNGCYIVPWTIGEPEWKDAFAAALGDYIDDPTDETWKQVQDAMK